jgi:hypothetical protein
VKIDSKGTTEWMSNLEEGSQITSIQRTLGGDYLAAGIFFVVDVKHGVFLSRLDNMGTIVWKKIYESKNYERVLDIKETKDGGCVLAGEIDQFDGISWRRWLEKIDAKGDIEWSKSFGRGSVSKIKQLDDGEYIAAGAITSPNYNSNLWIAKIDSNGSLEWEKSLGSNKSGGCYDMLQTRDGGFFVISSDIGTSKSDSKVIWLIQLDKDGKIVWDKKYSYPGIDKMDNSSSMDSPYSIKLIQDEGLIIITYQGRILKMNLNGELIWENIASGAANLNNNEQIGITPVEQVTGGYLIALRKVGYKLPVNPAVMSPEVYHKLIFAKFNLDGGKDWERILDFPVNEKP